MNPYQDLGVPIYSSQLWRGGNTKLNCKLGRTAAFCMGVGRELIRFQRIITDRYRTSNRLDGWISRSASHTYATSDNATYLEVFDSTTTSTSTSPPPSPAPSSATKRRGTGILGGWANTTVIINSRHSDSRSGWSVSALEYSRYFWWV
jgi:hypothetical protein